MSNVKNTVSNRLLAALVSLAIAISVFPVSILAADPGDSGAVTLIVTDTESNPIQGATVTYKVAPDTPDESVAEATATTDADGKAELASPQAYTIADGNKIYIQSIVADGYATKGSSEFTEIAIADVAVEETYVLELPNITDVEITPAEDLTYTGEAQTTVSIVYKAGDTVKCITNGGAEETFVDNASEDGECFIKATNVGTYEYEIIVEREDYADYTQTVNVAIGLGVIDLEGLTVLGVKGVYTGVAQEAVKVSIADGYSYTLKYQLDDGDEQVDDNAWVDEKPTVTNAGEYLVWVKAIKTDYEDKDVDVEAAEGAVAPANVLIEKATRDISFENFTNKSTEKKMANASDELTFDVTAKCTDMETDEAISYEISLTEDSDNIATDVSEIASIDITNIPTLIVKEVGNITVTAKLVESDNYKACEISHDFVITTDASIYFENDVTYVYGNTSLGKNSSEQDIISNLQITNNNSWDKRNSVKYSIDADKDIGISCDGSQNIVVTDYSALNKALAKEVDGELKFTVTAVKGAGYNFKEGEATYTLTIKYADIPESPYTLDGTKGKIGDADTEWYVKTPVKVVAADGYQIVADIEKVVDGIFGPYIEISDEGDAKRTVYLREITTGEITSAIAIDDIAIDTHAPSSENLGIKFSAPSFWEKILDKIFNFYDPKVEITFTVEDEVEDNESGLYSINWKYIKADDASSIVEEDMSGVITGKDIKLVEKNGSKYYEAILTLPESDAKELRGNISFTATDNAGNTTGETASNATVVVDTIPPVMDAAHFVANENVTKSIVDGVAYYDGDVLFEVTITEANFFGEDVEITIIDENGNEKSTSITNWEPDDILTDGYNGSFLLSGNGQYVVKIAHKDRSGNTAEPFVSETIIIDDVAPTIEVSYSKPQREFDGVSYYSEKIEATVVVTEKNFDPEDITISGTNIGIVGYPIHNKADVQIPWEKGDNPDEYIANFTISAEGDHRITASYIDKSGNKMDEYTATNMTIDKTAPTISVDYKNTDVINTLTDANGNERDYFDDTQTAEITINEHNFNADDVKFTIDSKDVSGKDVTTEIKYSEWKTDENNSDLHRMTITYPGDANYTFDVDYPDLATNKADEYTPDYFTVDKTAPKTLAVSYSTSVLDTVLESVDYGFYNAKMTVTITAQDDISGVHSFLYSYVNAKGVSTVNAQLIDQAIAEADIKYSDDGKTATATFEIPKLVLANDNQFNGTVTFTATDRAAQSASHKETKRIVVDNIAPTIEVGFNTPVLKENNISYYDGRINATVTINEANFYSNDVVVTVTKDGASRTVTPTWTHSSVDVHTGTFALTEDGDYVVTVAYKDKSGNTMATYKSNQLTIDTDIAEPVITVNGSNANGQAFKGDVMPAVTFKDDNFDSYEITLTRTNYGSKNVDVTTKFIGDSVTLNENGGTGTFDTFEKIAENDGIYTMTVSMTDKACHTTESSLTFTINRFGSVYEYSDYLVGLIKDGGAYIESITDDLIITEYNADRLLAGSLVIEITRDGKPIENVVYDISPVINDSVSVGSSGWFQYQYTISKANFEKDGIYKISVSSKDATGNTPETSNYDDKAILFRVDSTRPEITSIIGLEESIINATEVEVKFTVFDTMGLKSIKVYVDGELVKTITDFGDDLNNYTGSFVLLEDSTPQSVQIVVEDISGNITDTASEDFESAYVFNDSVTVSTNIFVRWFANKPLFWGSIAGVIGLITVFWFIIAKRRKEKEEEQTKAAK